MQSIELSLDHLTIAAQPYIKADLTVRSNVEPHEAPTAQLARLVSEIIEIEGPQHAEEVGRRISSAFGKGRTGSRIRSATEQAIAYALRQNSELRKADNFVFTRQQQEAPPIRDRAQMDGALLKAEYLPPMEVVAAAALILNESGGMNRDAHIRAVANLLGYQRVGPDLARVIGEVIADTVDA